MVRQKNRYILCELVFSDDLPTAKCKASVHDVQNAVRDVVSQIHGDYGSGAVAQGFTVKYVGMPTNTVLLKVRHSSVKFLTSALPFLKMVARTPCCLLTLHIAGTIRACQKFLVKHNRKKLAILYKQSQTKDDKEAVLEAIERCKPDDTEWTETKDESEDDDSDDDR